MRQLFIFIFSLCIIIFSCKTENTQEQKSSYTQVKNENKEETIKINRDLLSVNREVIDKYIERHNWKMTETESGLFYMITTQTTDEQVLSGCEVEFSFKTSLLNGTVIYESSKLGNRKLIIDKNQEESGLNEGLKLMKKGEIAYFILPPHLAFGVVGDSYLVPPYSVLVYEIEVIEINHHNNLTEENNNQYVL